jgi:8-oxo-dGTP pyrophosphatase MutT (NUDIX family)
MNTAHLVTLLENYKHGSDSVGSADQATNAQRILDFIALHPDTYWQRSEFDPGHVTASSWVVNAERTHVLLVNHLVYKQLVQLGGHIDPPDADLFAACLREVHEESGLEGVIANESIFDIDIHNIPAREKRNEPAHVDFDIRVLVEAPFTTPQPPEGESAEVRWYPITEVQQLVHGGVEGDSVHRMAMKHMP